VVKEPEDELAKKRVEKAREERREIYRAILARAAHLLKPAPKK
jgi:hypothetical protein